MQLTAAKIATLVSAEELSAAEMLACHETRHAETAALNALVQPRHAAARAEADRVAARIRGGVPMPLAGVPVSVKECFGIAGLKTTLGIPRRHGAVDPADCGIVTRLKALGAIIVGKANVAQAMFLHETDNPVWGRTINPHDASRGPGGSSGGDAALVAAGVVPLAIGTDLAGSVRQPAHACGIAGFLPRSAWLGDGGAFDTMPHLSSVRPRAGFLARRVDDLQLAFDSLVNASSSHGAVATRSARMRICWYDACGPIEPSVAVRRAVREAVATLERQGVEAVPMSGGLATDAAWIHMALLSADGGAAVRSLFAGTRPIPPVATLLRLAALPRWLRFVLSAVADVSGSHIEAVALRATGPRHARALEELAERRAVCGGAWNTAAAGFDAVVCPVSAVPALPHGTAARLVMAAAPCLLANLFDLPAGAVPVTRVDEREDRRSGSRDRVIRAAVTADRGSRGLPVGVQVIGLTSGNHSRTDVPERTVLELMRMIERGSGHSDAFRAPFR